ncbi:MAG: Fic family protein [Erysipelotrichia bacterium]|nr:Fic family protein [Erysipelotrichia bacterium]
MRIFDLQGTVNNLLSNPNIISLLNSIELYKGKTILAHKLKKVDKLTKLAFISATEASNAMGSIFIGDDRMKAIFEKEQSPRTLQEYLFQGYYKALQLIDGSYKYQPFDRSFISTLHYYLYKDYNPEIGGKYKDSVNFIQERMPNGTFRTIFVTAEPSEVPALLDNLVYQFNLVSQNEENNKLILILSFLLDFTCIHPFNHANGRVARLLLSFLMKKFGYDISNYFSVSYIIRQRISDYIDNFEASSKGWRENENDYTQYVTYMLKCILEAYRKLDYIMEVNSANGITIDKVYKIVFDSATPINKRVIENVLYGVSSVTIEKALATLVRDGKIQLIAKGRYSKYFRL